MEEEKICYYRNVNYYETDRMGIVHHSNYIRYFEEARLELMEKLGLAYTEIEKRGIIIPVMFVNCEYLSPLRYGDRFRVETKLEKYRGLKMEVSYEIYQEGDSKLCTRGVTGHCFLYPDMKPVRLKRDFPDIHKRLEQAMCTIKQ